MRLLIAALLLATVKLGHAQLIFADGLEPLELTQVEQWQQLRLSYVNESWSGNPFDVVCRGVFTHQASGRRLRQFCFYAGDNTWNLYFMPDEPGIWSYTTNSPDADLDDHTGQFQATPGSLPGALQRNRKRWEYANGDPISPILIPSRQYIKATPIRRLRSFLNWSRNTVGAHLIGTTLVYFNHGQEAEPYLESAEGEEFYIPMWDRLNDVYDYLRDQGMGHYIMFYSDDGESPSNHGIPEGDGGTIGPEEERLFRYVVARFAPYPMVIWDTGIDIGEYRSDTWIDNFARWFRNNDPWRHPVSSRSGGGSGGTLPARATYWSDGEDRLPSRVQAVSIWQDRSIPTLYSDRWREDGGRGDFDRERIRQAVWEMGLTGGTGVYVSGNENGGYLEASYRSDFQAAPDVGRASRFFHEQVYGLGQLSPADNLVVAGSDVVNALAAQSGQEYVAYLVDGGSFSLNLSGVNGTLNGRWYNPRNGSSIALAPLQNPSNNEAFTSPGGSDWVLHLWSPTLE